MDRKLIINLALIAIIGIALLAFLAELRGFTKDGVACQSQPMIYGADAISEKLNTSISCSCFLGNGVTLNFDNNEFKTMRFTQQLYGTNN